MTDIFLKLINLSLTAGWIVPLVLLLRLILKKAPAWINCALWGIVGLRLLLPFSIESVVSLIPSAQPVPSDIALMPVPAINSGITVVDQVVNPMIAGSFTPEPSGSVNSLQVTLWVASCVWIIGVATMLIYGAVSTARLYRRVRPSLLDKENIYYCDGIDTPFILGVVRPRIFLPSTIETSAVEHVIEHEKAHLRRRDHWWKPLGFVLLSVHWFNPLLWVAYILLCRDIEKACDQKVIKEMDDEGKKAYSLALVACSVHRRTIAACPLAFGEVGVKDRVRSVLNYRKPAFWVILVAIVAGVAVGVCFLTDPLTRDETEASSDTETESETDTETEIESNAEITPGGYSGFTVVERQGDRTEFSLPEFPDVTFTVEPSDSSYGNVLWATANGEKTKLGAMGSAVFLADLTGDGVTDISYTGWIGSGICTGYVVVYDYATKRSGILNERAVYDYELVEIGGRLLIKKTDYHDPWLVEFGYVSFSAEADPSDKQEAPNPLMANTNLIFVPLFSPVETYTLEGGDKYQTLTLLNGNVFYLVSDHPHIGYQGFYELDDEHLYLRVNGQERVYVFRIEADGRLVLDISLSENVGSVPKYMTDGAIFIKKET